MPSMDRVANGGAESSADSPAAADEDDVPKSSPAAAISKGRGLRRWRRIRREQRGEGAAAAAAVAVGGGGGDEDSAQLHKRRLPLAAGAPKGKHEAAAGLAEEESSVESRFVPLPGPPARLDPGLGSLVAAPAGFSVGADSDGSEGRGSSRSSTAASAPRVLPRHGHERAPLFPRERDRPRPRAAGASLLHGKSARAARARGADRPRVSAAAAAYAEAENSRSSVESDLRSSNASNARRSGVVVADNGVLSDYRDNGDEGQLSEEVRSTAGGYYKENGSSVMGSFAWRSADSDGDVKDTFDEGSAGKGQNGGMHLDADPYAESILKLQRTQEALENEIEKFMVIGKEPRDDFAVHNDERSCSVHLEEPIEEISERMKHFESRLEDASALIKEKDSRILEPEALGQVQPGQSTIDYSNLLSSHSELDGLYQEKMEAEIQCTILTRACQTWATLGEDQMALYEAQKSLSEDYKQLGLKLRHTEKRAMVLEEMAEKLQVQCKELSRSSEVLQLQSKASRVSLFCFVQIILLCIAIGIYVMRLSPSSAEVVPT